MLHKFHVKYNLIDFIFYNSSLDALAKVAGKCYSNRSILNSYPLIKFAEEVHVLKTCEKLPPTYNFLLKQAALRGPIYALRRVFIFKGMQLA
jgi:hypothetical protein